MDSNTDIDYFGTGLTVQQAMVDHVNKEHDKKKRTDYILWNGKHVKTSDAITVPTNGVVKAEILSAAKDVEQGFDLKVNGWFELQKCEHVQILRTWKSDKYEDIVEYPYLSKDNKLYFWNVYVRTFDNGQKSEEKWTGNAGFWIERVSSNEIIYHCNHGLSMSSDFNTLVVRIIILSSS